MNVEVCSGTTKEKKQKKKATKTELVLSVMLGMNTLFGLSVFFKIVIHAVQKSFDSFDAVLIDLLSHFNLIVLFCGIVAACCV